MKKFNPNKNIIIALIVVIVLVAVVSITGARRNDGGKISAPGQAVNDSVSLLDSLVGFPGKIVQDGVTTMQNLLTTYQENQQLKAKLDNYDEAILKAKNAEKEADNLRKELDLNQTLTSYEKLTANVITRSPDTWQDMLVVDKGSADGVEVNMAVMSQQGLVGRVIQVSKVSSKVELLTSTNQTQNHFPLRISSEGGDSFGLLNRYDEEKQAFVVNQLTGTAQLKKGDVVQTSGLGGNSPADLYVGTVEGETENKTGLNREVYVKPAAQMYDISVVTIVKRMVQAG
jgi:rod shape-determining protein MreC